MLGQRLDKLEHDLLFLIEMQDFLYANDIKEVHNEGLSDEIPERDIPETRRLASKKCLPVDETNSFRKKAKHKLDKNKESIIVRTAANNISNIKNVKDASDPLHLCYDDSYSEVPISPEMGHPPYVEKTSIFNGIGDAAMKFTDDLEREKSELKAQLNAERNAREELENIAKQVNVKLQKVEDELSREKRTKESLLLGTLELKNMIQGYSTQINDLQSEVQRLTCNCKNASTENADLIQNLKNLCNEVRFRKGWTNIDIFRESFVGGFSALSCIEFLKAEIHDLIKSSSNNEESVANEQIRKLTGQMNNCVGRCAKLEKELKQSQECESHLKKELHASEVALTATKTELFKQQIELECKIQKITSTLNLEREKAALKISEYDSVIRRTKQLLLSLRNERDESRRICSEKCDLNANMQHSIMMVNECKTNLESEVTRLSQQIQNVTNQKASVDKQLQNERMNFEVNLKKILSDKTKRVGLMNEMKHQLITMKHQNEHCTAVFNVEKERLLYENKRLDENMRVLQKVSEDQGHSIQKLRGDLEDLKNCNLKMDTQLRNYECAEKSLIHKFEQSEKECVKYAKIVEDLEDKIESYQEDMRTHDCDEFSSSKYKKQLKEVEESLHVKLEEWKNSMRQLEREKEEAISATRKTLQKSEEISNTFEALISQTKEKYQAEIKQLKQQQDTQNTEHLTKMQSVQSELDRMNLSSSQIQRALLTKIQQLQTALRICLGGSNQNNNSTLDVGLLHQLHHPLVSAFGYRNVDNTNNNSASANLLNTGGQTQAQPCFRNFNVNGCTSGNVGGLGLGTCNPTTGSSGVDFSNLML